MPGYDRTGPMGMGPRTGGGFGLCGPGPRPAAGYAQGYPGRGAGRGFRPRGGGRGRAWGGGRGLGRLARFGGWDDGFGGYPRPYGAFAPLTREQEIEELKNQAAYLEQEKKGVQERIAELNSESGKAEPKK